MIFVVTVRTGIEPIYMHEGKDDKLYVRTGAGKRALDGRSAIEYYKQHWGRRSQAKD